MAEENRKQKIYFLRQNVSDYNKTDFSYYTDFKLALIYFAYDSTKYTKRV